MCQKNPPSPLARTAKGLGGEEEEDGPAETRTVETAEETEAEAVGALEEAKGIFQVAPRQAVSKIPRDSTP